MCEGARKATKHLTGSDGTLFWLVFETHVGRDCQRLFTRKTGGEKSGKFKYHEWASKRESETLNGCNLCAIIWPCFLFSPHRRAGRIPPPPPPGKIIKTTRRGILMIMMCCCRLHRLSQLLFLAPSRSIIYFHRCKRPGKEA